MSAILARVHFSGGRVDPQAFAAALAALAPYGRDGASHWIEGPRAFGIQRLDIAPTSVHDRQPLVDGSLLIVADALLDNRESLFDQLAIEPGERARIADSRLVLLAYRRWGRQCVERLVGDFAFALWDARQQALFCARDHIGTRPLYYSWQHHACLVATDISALKAFPDLSLKIDEARVADYLRLPLDCREAGFFRGIHHLPAGHCLWADRHGVTLHAHWQPRDVPSIRYARRDDYVAHFRELLELAVSDRLNTGFPVGSHLSGGLDSSGVTVLASQLMQASGRRLDMSYSWSPAISRRYPLNTPRDERRVIEEICRREGLECCYGTTSGSDFVRFLSRDIALDGTTDLFEEWDVMRRAARRGTRVLLSGWGGDECATFGVRGYPGYLLKRGQWLRLVSIARRAAGGYRHPGKLVQFLWQDALLTLLPDPVYARFSPYVRPDDFELLARPDFIERFTDPRQARPTAWRDYPDPIAMQALLLENGHLATRMATWAHWSSHYGIVYRYPLTDLRLLRFVLGLPPELLWHRGQARSLYREALGERLPRGVGKSDIVNEAKRMRIRAECWRLLAQEAKKGCFQRPCGWLDMAALQARLLAPPGNMTAIEQVKRFLPLSTSLQVWHLWQRYGEA